MNVLAISDLHAPFTHPRYFEFICDIHESHDFDEVVFLGDIVDLHALSFHEHDPDGLSPGHEIIAAKRQLRKWVEKFPEARVCIGNHDARTIRLARKAGLPMEAVKDFAEIWDTPGWDWQWEHVINDVLYTHGTGTSGVNAAVNLANKRGMSTVIGHLHKNAGVLYGASQSRRIFGMNAGCGIDVHAYAFNYGKDFVDKPVLGAGIILDTVGYFEPMECAVGEAYER